MSWDVVEGARSRKQRDDRDSDRGGHTAERDAAQMCNIGMRRGLDGV